MRKRIRYRAVGLENLGDLFQGEDNARPLIVTTAHFEGYPDVRGHRGECKLPRPLQPVQTTQIPMLVEYIGYYIDSLIGRLLAWNTYSTTQKSSQLAVRQCA